jgi:hydroxyacylglutathione hydrolase
MSSPPPTLSPVIIQRFFDAPLAQYSYLIGCQASGEAIVIDPNRDSEQYLRAAADEKLRITAVTETHIHADFVSGARELAQRAGATLYLSDEGDADWKYAYAAADGAVLVHDGDTVRVGNVALRVVHTPGHTPEHISFLITDTAAATEPIAIVTGDFVFVGDVGRPDLLERAAKVKGTMIAAAHTLYASLQRFKAYPDWLQIWPGHGAGSACGKGLSAIPHSTVGYERRFNWALATENEDEFVRMVLDGQPEPPTYFARMKRINKAGPPALGGMPHPARETLADLDAALTTGAVVVDTRRAAEFAAAHIPGTLNLPIDKSFSTWAGWLLPFDVDLHLIVDEPGDSAAAAAARQLAMIGFDRVAGYFGAAIVDEWRASGRALGTVAQITTRELASRVAAGTVAVIDVRNRGEWNAGHLAGAAHIPLGELAERIPEVPLDRPVVVHCQGGGRSAIAASLLKAHGIRDVANLTGGFGAWSKDGFVIARDD